MSFATRKIGGLSVPPTIGFGTMVMAGTYGGVGDEEERFKGFKRTGTRNDRNHSKKLGVDLYYTHRPNTTVLIEHPASPQWQNLTRPVSSFTLEIEDPRVALLDTCRKLGVAVVAYSTLGRGLLSGTIPPTGLPSSCIVRDLGTPVSIKNVTNNVTDRVKSSFSSSPWPRARVTLVHAITLTPPSSFLPRPLVLGKHPPGPPRLLKPLPRHQRTHDDLPKKDFRRLIPRYNPENFPNILKIVDGLAAIGAKYNNESSNQLTLAWLLAESPEIIPIPGTTKIKYLEENVAAAALVLSDEDVAAIRQLTKDAHIDADRSPPPYLSTLYSFAETL
ncbi:NADP-dependent oxidoreductase domain-containing protein [Mycena epipterygia]|nr:NADP-dependent oxidoreductase domain-containing protein [Mycena epipterygia]